MKTPENKSNNQSILRLFGNGLTLKDIPGVIDPDCIFNYNKQIYEPRISQTESLTEIIKTTSPNKRRKYHTYIKKLAV